MPESRDESTDHSLDYPGSLAVVAGLALLTYGFLKIPQTGFNNWQVYVSLAAGFLSLIIFIIIEKRSKHPMMPLELFRNKTFTGANLLTFFLYAALTCAMLFLTLNMVQAQGYSQLQAGLTLLPFTILLITISRWSGGLVDKYGPVGFSSSARQSLRLACYYCPLSNKQTAHHPTGQHFYREYSFLAWACLLRWLLLRRLSWALLPVIIPAPLRELIMLSAVFLTCWQMLLSVH